MFFAYLLSLFLGLHSFDTGTGPMNASHVVRPADTGTGPMQQLRRRPADTGTGPMNGGGAAPADTGTGPMS